MNEEQLNSYLFNREKRETMVYFNDEWNNPTASKYEHLEDHNLIGGLTMPKESSSWWSKMAENDKNKNK